MSPRVLVLVYVAALCACEGERRVSGAQSGPRPAARDAAATGEMADAAADSDGNNAGLPDGSSCVPACASHELFDRACGCLGVCDRGYAWDGRACLPDEDTDAGTAVAPDGSERLDGTPASPGADATSTPDVGVDPPDAGVGAPDVVVAPDADLGAPDAVVAADAVVAPDVVVARDVGFGADAAPSRDASVPQPLDAPCALDTDCASRACFDLGGANGRRCVATCGSSSDCPTRFTCYDYSGAKLCLNARLFTGAGSDTFTLPAGAACTSGAQCRSSYCSQVCIESCAHNSDCPASNCNYVPFGVDARAMCDAPLGVGAAGAACLDGGDCQTGLCVDDVCVALCDSTARCAFGSTCTAVDASQCASGTLTSCTQWEANLVTACVALPHGSGPVGAACADYSSCRSGLCMLSVGECTDFCAVHADCPPSFRCAPVFYGDLPDGSPLFANICSR
jgi:hypothetical protein